MYNASAQFHNAVFQNSPNERVLFHFTDDTILTNEDIFAGNGIKFIEGANLEEELTIGACPSSSLDATIMNYQGLLSGYSFGECTVSLGVRTSVATISAEEANAVAIMYYGGESPIRFCGYSSAPYVTVNDIPTSAQPSFAVQSILIVDSKIYCFGANGEVWAATWNDGTTWNAISSSTWDDVSDDLWVDLWGTLVPSADVQWNLFMVEKFKQWAAAHRGMSYSSCTLYEFTTAGKVECYEYIKLGQFRITTPKKTNVQLISTTAFDKMTLFDADASAFLSALTYPITLGEIFSQLCAFVGVGRATQTFINSARSFSAAPVQTEGVTAKEVLGWIAEAACSFARMTRDGEVELAWFGDISCSIPATQLFSADVAEYNVAAIDKLHILNAKSDVGVIIGTGTNGYQIVENPYLSGDTDQQIRTYGTPIYNRLSAFSAFAPVSATAVCDWSIQAGDIISIVLKGVTHTFPIYCQTITWNGKARVSYESTGKESRPVMNVVNRKVWNQNRAMHELVTDVNGISLRLTNTEGDIASLDFTINGLSLALTNNKLLFDKAGLHIYNGGFDIWNGSSKIFGVDSTGQIAATGSFISKNASWEAELTSAALTFKRGSITRGYIGGNDSAGLWYSGDFYCIGGSGTPATARAILSCNINDGNGHLDLRTSGGVRAIDLSVGDSYDSISFRAATGSGTTAVLAQGSDGSWSFFRSTSARKYKKNIQQLDINAASIIDQLEPVIYEDINGNGTRYYGFIADDVAEICPSLVAYDINGDIDSLYYDRFSTLFAIDLQKVHSRLNAIENKLKLIGDSHD